jgi:hypothetical protein
MSYRETEHLRVLIANERKDALALDAPVVVALGHEGTAVPPRLPACDTPNAPVRR